MSWWRPFSWWASDPELWPLPFERRFSDMVIATAERRRGVTERRGLQGGKADGFL